MIQIVLIILINLFIQKTNAQNSLNTIAPLYSIREPSYLIIAPRVIRPAEKIKISCSILNKQWYNIMVKAYIITDDQEIASGFQELIPNVPNTIALKVKNL